MRTGVFPHGPAPAMQAELYRREQAIRALVGALNRIRSQMWNVTGGDLDREAKMWEELHTGKCIICGTDRGPVTRDLDTLFCSRHCPVCNGEEAIIDKD